MMEAEHQWAKDNGLERSDGGSGYRDSEGNHYEYEGPQSPRDYRDLAEAFAQRVLEGFSKAPKKK